MELTRNCVDIRRVGVFYIRRAECFYTISGFSNYYECWCNYISLYFFFIRNHKKYKGQQYKGSGYKYPTLTYTIIITIINIYYYYYYYRVCL